MSAVHWSHAAPGVGFRGPQVCALVGVTYRQLDYWARTNLIRPSLAGARGSGSINLYSEDDLVLLAVIKAILDAGVSLQACRPLLDELREKPDTEFVLLSDREVTLASVDTIVDLVRTGPPVSTVLAFQSVRERVLAAIAAQEGER